MFLLLQLSCLSVHFYRKEKRKNRKHFETEAPFPPFLFFLLFPECCIFHKKKRFDESSSDESSSESEGEEGHVCGDDCVHKEFSLFDAMPPDIRKDFEPSS